MIRTYLGLFVRAAISTLLLITLLGTYIEYVGADWVYEEDVQMSKGYLKVLDQAFSRDEGELKAFEDRYSELLGFTVSLVGKEEIDELSLTRQYDGVLIDVEEDYFYWPVSATKQLKEPLWLKIDPLEGTSDTGGNYLIFMIVVICAVAMFLWCWPLMRRLGRLKEAADAYGRGQLDVRVEDKKKDEVNKIMMSFNSMAAQLGVLMDKQRTANQAFSHEIRTPLSRIKMLVHDLSKEKKESLLEEVDEIDFLVGEILSYSNIQSVSEKNQQEWFDVYGWLNAHFEDWVVPEDIHYDYEVNSSLHKKKVWGNQGQLEILLCNLLLNATRYAKSKVRLNSHCHEGEWIICVEDDGCGVSEDIKEKIFEPFYRADDSRSRETGGSGMGLAIAKKIAEYHSAQLLCSDSEDLGGAAFILKIPVD